MQELHVVHVVQLLLRLLRMTVTSSWHVQPTG